MRPAGDRIWMIGDNPHNDILGAQREIGAVPLQKVHFGVAVGEGDEEPDASFGEFSMLSDLLSSFAR